MDEVPPLPGEEALYAWIRSVWDAASKDPATKQALVKSFLAADREIVAKWFEFKYNGRPIGNGWTAPGNGYEWGTDYLNRTAIAKSSMYQNTPEETQYQFKETDSQGHQLNGNNQYTVTFPKGKLPPVEGFWSLTLYNAEHFFHANQLNRFSLGAHDQRTRARPQGDQATHSRCHPPCGQSHQPLPDQLADAAGVEERRRRRTDDVHPERVPGQGTGIELATCPAGTFRHVHAAPIGLKTIPLN